MGTEKFGIAVFPSDAVYNAVNYGPPAVLHGMCAKPEEFGSSIEKCRKLTDRENGILFFSHDMACYRDYKKSPECYGMLQLPAMLCSNLAQAAACLAVAIRTKDKDLKAAMASAISSAMAGITEPALYGVTMRLKKPLMASIIGSGIDGLFGGSVGLKAYAFLTPLLLSLPIYISSQNVLNIVYAVVVCVSSVVATFILTLIMGWEEN